MSYAPPPALISARLVAAAASLDGLPENFIPSVTPASDSRFGDYQTNAALLLAKPLRSNPRAVAQRLADAFDPAGLCHPPDIAGPGFLNFRLTPAALAAHLRHLAQPGPGADRLGVPSDPAPRHVVIDYSSPNVAKPMHIGHIRSTLLGQSLARIARFLGHKVTTDNHIGDWGTQFGMVIHGFKNHLDRQRLSEAPMDEIVRVYKYVNQLCKDDPAVRDQCKQELVRLQAGDPANLAVWQECVDLSLADFRALYARLGVEFDLWLGESFYNPMLAPMVENLLERGIAQLSEGAACIFFPENPRLAEKPCLIRKGDGGFGYATSDLATVQHRRDTLKADSVWYVVGAPQQLHLEQIFAASEKIGWTGDFHHIAFGSILGEDRKLMKTRSGENVLLRDVLDEAESRALERVKEKNPEMPEAEQREIARLIGVGAVKYAELSQHRVGDYIFSYDKMLALQGNTAPYLFNAYVRIQSIFRRLAAEEPGFAFQPETIQPVLEAEAEINLARKLQQFVTVVPATLDGFRPNLLANYLYELADTFHGFYEHCPVLKADPSARPTRLLLAHLTAAVLHRGLDLLGIIPPERM